MSDELQVDNLVNRVKLRYFDEEEMPSDETILEILSTVVDRIKIRVESTKTLPAIAGSIVVDVAMRCLRLRGFEGTTSESAADGGSISNSFIDDVLKDYTDDIAALKNLLHKPGIKFL